MALHLKFSLPNEDFPRSPGRPRSCSGSQPPSLDELWTESQELLQISSQIADWSRQTTDDIASQLRSLYHVSLSPLLDSGSDSFVYDEVLALEPQKENLLKSLLGSIYQHVTSLENTVSAMLSRRTNLTERENKQALSKAFSQLTNNIWGQMSAFVNNSPGFRTAEILKHLLALNDKAQITYSRFVKQRKRCEDQLRSLMTSFQSGQVLVHTQEDSVMTEKAWETPTKTKADSYLSRQTLKIMEAIAGVSDERVSDLHYQALFSEIETILKDCASPRKESEVVKELEKEVEKVKWRADVLAKSLRESQRQNDSKRGNAKGEAGSELTPMWKIDFDKLQVLYESQSEDLLLAQRDKDRIKQENSILTKRYQETVNGLEKQLSKCQSELQSICDQANRNLSDFNTFQRRAGAVLQTYQTRVTKLSELVRGMWKSTRANSERVSSEYGLKLSIANHQLTEIDTLAHQVKLLTEQNAAQARELHEKKTELKYSQEGIGSHVIEIKRTLEALSLRSKVSLSIQQFPNQGFVSEKKDGKVNRAEEEIKSLTQALQALQAREVDILKACQSCADQESNPVVLVSRLMADMKETQERVNQWIEAFSPLLSGQCTPETAKAELIRCRKDLENATKEQMKVSLQSEQKKERVFTSHNRHQSEHLEAPNSTDLSEKIQELKAQLKEMEEENAYLSKENFDFLTKIEEFKTEKSNNLLNLADLKSTLQQLEIGWAEAKRREEELKTELVTMTESLELARRINPISGEPISLQPEEVRRILDDVEEKDKEIMHLKTITKNYRNQLCVLKAQLQERESVCKALQDQQLLIAQKLQMLQQPLDPVIAEAVQCAAELVVCRNKYQQEAANGAKLMAENLALDNKNKLLMNALAEVKESERVLSELTPPESGTTLNFEEEEIQTELELSNASLTDDWRAFLNLDESAEVCTKVNFSGRYWALIKLPKEAYCWVALDASPSELTVSQMGHKYQEIERLMKGYQTSTDMTLTISRMLCVLEKAKLLQLPSVNHSMDLTVQATVIDAERVQGLVLKLIRLLPSL